MLILQGVFGGNGGILWFFDGEFVVKCVVKRGGTMVSFCGRKIRHGFQLYF
jgi:hypothetical protein